MIRKIFANPILFPYAKIALDVLHERRADQQDLYRRRYAFYQQCIRPGDLCFDIGANVGNRTKIFLDLGARVVAVEPQAKCCKVMQLRYGRNPRLTILQSGVGAKIGQAKMLVCEESPEVSTIQPAWTTSEQFKDLHLQWNKQMTIPITTLDELIKKYGVPNFCKIDVEGAEDQVLAGLHRPIPHLSFEFAQKSYRRTSACLRLLEKNGSVLVNYSLGESMCWMSKKWMSGLAFLKLIRASKTRLLWGDVYVRAKAKKRI